MSKWVQSSPGRHKLVEDDDERPAVKLKKRKGAPVIKFVPSWKKHEKEMNLPHIGDKDQMDATDKFMSERDHAMKIDSKARRWEESRKETLAKNKPAWRKKMMRQKIC